MGISYNPSIVTNGLVLALDAANTKSYSSSSGAFNFTTPALMNGSTTYAPMLCVTVNSSGLFVAVGENFSGAPVFATSSNGSTWTTPALINGSTAYANLVDIAVNSSGRFVAVGINDGVQPTFTTSTNGSTWTTPATMNGSVVGADMKSVTVNSSGLFVAIGADTDFTAPVYATSTNGTTWTTPARMNGSAAFANMQEVTVNSSGLFVAVGFDNVNAPLFATSTNGSTWTTPARMNGSAVFAQMFGVAVNSSGLFVAVGADTSNRPLYATSSNGSTWTTPALINGSTVYARMQEVTVDSNGLFVALGEDSIGAPVFATSANGSTWTTPARMNGFAANAPMRGIAVNSSGLFVTVGLADGTAAPTYATSTNPASTAWTDLSGLGNNGTLVNGATYNSANSGSIVFDGTNDYITLPVATTSGQAVTYAGWLYSTETTATYRNFVDSVSQNPMIWWNTSGQIEFDAAAYTATPIYRNQWVYVALSKPAGSSAASYYVNGVLVGTGSAYTTPTATPTWFNRATSQTWKGNCSQFSRYNRALTATEIQQNFNATKSRYIRDGDGSSASNAAPSASYLVSLGITTNGYYYINLPTVGPTQIYCILDPAVDGGGWMVLWGAASGATNYTYSFSASRDDILTSPINGFYSLSYAKRSAINAICTQNKTLVYGGTNSNWLRFDGYIWNSNSHTSGDFRFEFNTSLVTSNGTVDSSAEVGLTNYGVSGGGDFGIAINTDGLDHHATVSYYNLNGGCVNMYLYQYAAGYKVNTALSGWYNQTSACTSSNSNELPLLVAMK